MTQDPTMRKPRQDKTNAKTKTRSRENKTRQYLAFLCLLRFLLLLRLALFLFLLLFLPFTGLPVPAVAKKSVRAKGQDEKGIAK